MESFVGLGAELSVVQGPQAPVGVKRAEPLCFVIAFNCRFELLVT